MIILTKLHGWGVRPYCENTTILAGDIFSLPWKFEKIYLDHNNPQFFLLTQYVHISVVRIISFSKSCGHRPYDSVGIFF